MKIPLFATFFLALRTLTFGQSPTIIDTSDCTILLNRLSENWKLDSTGNNGFRWEHRNDLLSCKRQQFTKNSLLMLLGKPNEIRDVYKAKEFLYYYYDFRTLPRDKDGPLA